LECSDCGTDLDDAVDVSQVLKDNESAEGSQEKGEEREAAAGLDGDNGRAALIFPWGNEAIRGQLNIGRDAMFSTLGEKIACLDREQLVSRRHAEVFLDDGYLFVRHIGTQNPTYINGAPLEYGDVIQLADGDEVRFSKQLVAKVILG
jgi:hypothetical protein